VKVNYRKKFLKELSKIPSETRLKIMKAISWRKVEGNYTKIATLRQVCFENTSLYYLMFVLTVYQFCDTLYYKGQRWVQLL